MLATLFLDDGKKISLPISNRLWCMYRGTQVSPDLLESILMSLERFFLERGKSTKNHNLELAFLKAKQRFSKKNGNLNMKTEIVFNVNYPTNDSLLNLADYFCWTIQRVFEKGEIRYYNFIKDQIKLVIDVYDTNNYDKWKNYYDNKRILYLY